MPTNEVVEMFHKNIKAGKTIKEISKEMSIPERTLYTWRKKIGQPAEVTKTEAKKSEVKKELNVVSLLQKLLNRFTSAEEKIEIFSALKQKGLKTDYIEKILGFKIADAQKEWDLELKTIIKEAHSKHKFSIQQISQELKKHQIKLSVDKIKQFIK